MSTGSMAALDATEQALWRMMSAFGSPLDDLEAAAAADPDWCMPLLMHAGHLLSLTEPSVVAEAHALLDRTEPMIARSNHRERDHLIALHTLAAGDWHGACREWESLLLRHPRDALALQWAHLFDFYRGDTLNLRQRVARVLPEWDPADGLHPFVLGLYAFGLEENQLYAQAEDAGRLALAGDARVPWAIHAVAHVMEMQGRYQDGLAWMSEWRGVWAEGNGLAAHLGWHDALFAVEALDPAPALHCFDTHLGSDPAQLTLQRLDAAALLWRLSLLDIDVGPRWHQVLAGWDLSDAAAGSYPFNDLHAMLALIGSGDLVGAEDWMTRSSAQAERAGGSNRAVAREVGVPLMRGLLAFAQRRFDPAIEALYPLRALARRLGGSHAQRDLIDQTLMAAAARANDAAVGRALLNERLLAKPSTPLTEHWARTLGMRRKLAP